MRKYCQCILYMNALLPLCLGVYVPFRMLSLFDDILDHHVNRDDKHAARGAAARHGRDCHLAITSS